MAQRHPELPNVPSIGEFIKTDEAKKTDPGRGLRLRRVGPALCRAARHAQDRVQILRSGLSATFKDPEFLADAHRARLDLAPLSGEDIEKTVARILNLEKPLLEKLKEILK